MISPQEKALLHIYPDLARISDPDRREILMHAAGVTSSSDPVMNHAGCESAMATYEAILWDRVDQGVIPDPRLCKKCLRPMNHVGGGMGECPEGCGKYKIYAWTRDYWRKRLPAPHGANTRQIWKLREIWTILQDYLPESDRNERYLAGIIAKCSKIGVNPQALMESERSIAWHRLTSQQVHLATEAVKDRLHYAIKKAAP